MGFQQAYIVQIWVLFAGEASYEDEDYKYDDEDYEYEYVDEYDDCIDADDDGYCETDEDYGDGDYAAKEALTPDFGEDTMTVRVDMGNTARITCTVHDLGTYFYNFNTIYNYKFFFLGSSVISWKKGDSFLSLGGSLLTSDDRFSVAMTESTSTLMITLVYSEDAGQYVCHVATTEPMAKTFSIEIKGEPKKSGGLQFSWNHIMST